MFRARLEHLAEDKRTPILIGALDKNADHTELNTAYLISPEAPEQSGAASLQRYHKMKLVPFGEYVPRFVPALLDRYWRTTGDFAPGAVRTLLSLTLRTPGGAAQAWQRAQLAPSICFEAILPGWFNTSITP